MQAVLSSADCQLHHQTDVTIAHQCCSLPRLRQSARACPDRWPSLNMARRRPTRGHVLGSMDVQVAPSPSRVQHCMCSSWAVCPCHECWCPFQKK